MYKFSFEANNFEPKGEACSEVGSFWTANNQEIHLFYERVHWRENFAGYEGQGGGIFRVAEVRFQRVWGVSGLYRFLLPLQQLS